MSSRKRKISLRCNTCGKDVLKNKNDYYMLKDSVWAEICSHDYVDPRYVLCKECAEYFLGRRLTAGDLASGIPINEGLDWS